MNPNENPPPNEDFPENNEEDSDHLAFLPADHVPLPLPSSPP